MCLAKDTQKMPTLPEELLLVLGVEGQHLLSPEKGVEKQRLPWQGRGCFSEHALAQGLLCSSRGPLPNS